MRREQKKAREGLPVRERIGQGILDLGVRNVGNEEQRQRDYQNRQDMRQGQYERRRDSGNEEMVYKGNTVTIDVDGRGIGPMETPEFRDPDSVMSEIMEPEFVGGTLPAMALPGVGNLGGVVDALVAGAFAADLANSIADLMGGTNPQPHQGHEWGKRQEWHNRSLSKNEE